MPVFTLIATGCRYRKIFFYKKALGKYIVYWTDTVTNCCCVNKQIKFIINKYQTAVDHTLTYC